jgi:dihydrofolate reductase
MKKIRYGVAMSLDGYIAGPNGEADWIVIEPEFDFAELWAQFDTLLMGRRTYAAAVARLGESSMQGMKIIIVSRTLRREDHPGISIVSQLDEDSIKAMRAQSSKDIWLFGGGDLFRQMLALKAVDTIELSVIPVLLGGGLPFLPPPAQQTKLNLTSHKAYPTGRMQLVYEVL